MISVYHLKREVFLDRTKIYEPTEEHAAQAKLDWQAGHYEVVADVLTDDVDKAWQLTNTISRPWWQNAEVTPRFVGHSCSGVCRSTSIGDILQTDDGYQLVMPVGFASIDLVLKPVSWKPEVQTDSTGKWYGNALRFATEQEALANVRGLATRWTAVLAARAAPSQDLVTCWLDAHGALRFLPDVGP